MAQIHNDQQVYALLGRLFESVVADDEIGPRLHTVDAIVQQQFRRPDATVTMKLLAGEDREVITGETDLRPEVVLVMDAVTGHRVWLGELSAMVALSKGQIRARGPVAKILRLIDLVALVAPRYRAQLDALTARASGGTAPEKARPTQAPRRDAAAEDVAAEQPEDAGGGAARRRPRSRRPLRRSRRRRSRARRAAEEPEAAAEASRGRDPPRGAG